MIRLRRVYGAPRVEEGERYLVDRLWPRGVKKADLQLDGWLKDVAPSGDLRRWFNHDPDRWNEFRRRYFAELDGKPESWQPLARAACRADVTLLYGARDTERNNAVALREYLQMRVRK